MAVSTGDIKAGMGIGIGMDEILVSVLELEVCIYSLL